MSGILFVFGWFVMLAVTTTPVTCSTLRTKKELKLVDCGGSDTLITVQRLRDTAKPHGPVTFESVLKADFVSRYNANHDINHDNHNKNHDNHNKNRKNHKSKIHMIHHKSSHVNLKINIKRWLGFWYVGIPSSLMKKLLHSMENKDTQVDTHSNMLHMSCVEDECLPRAGQHFKIIRMEEVLSDWRSFSKLLHLLGSGWYKLEVQGWTMYGHKAFCFNVELKTQF